MCLQPFNPKTVLDCDPRPCKPKTSDPKSTNSAQCSVVHHSPVISHSMKIQQHITVAMILLIHQVYPRIKAKFAT